MPSRRARGDDVDLGRRARDRRRPRART
jgi:hypothetical protein